MQRFLLFCYFLIFSLVNAKSTPPPPGPPLEACNIGPGEQRGMLDDKVIDEASGLAVSGLTEGLMWTITDHGGQNRVYGLTEDGNRVVDVILEGVENHDWEDIAVNVEDGQSFIYVSDTGDNDHDKPSRYIYKFAEPAITGEEGEEIVVQQDAVTTMEVTYPDFKYDCEALAVDPVTRDIFLFTKDREEWLSEVFLAPPTGGALQHIATLPLFWVTGADISPSGSTLGLTNKQTAWSFTKGEGETWVDFLASSPVPCQLILEEEIQREAIAATDGGYWTTSECKDDPPCPLWYYPQL